MKRSISILAFLALWAVSVSAQKIEKPTLTAKLSTPEQEASIREGIALHDKKDFDGAIEKYKHVLLANPDNTLALYELAMSYYTKGAKADALEISLKGSKYRSDELPLFYGVIASVVDDAGKPEEALKIYRDAIKILEKDKEYLKHLANIYFNMGITYTRQKKYIEARKELKTAVELDYSYPSPHFVLAQVFYSSRYKVPALLAASRFVTVEYNTQRTVQASRMIAATVDGGQRNPKTGNIIVNLDFLAPTDEGDFTMYDLMLGTLMTIEDEKDEKKNRSKGEKFVDALNSLIAMFVEDKKLKSTFVGKQYVNYLDSMKKAGHTPAFAYLVLRQAGGSPEAEKWTDLNSDKVLALIGWAKTYRPASN